MAAAAPNSPEQICLSLRAPLSSAAIAACTQAIDAGSVDGADRARAFYHRGRARQALGDKPGADADYRAAIAQYTETLSTSHPQPDRLYGRATAYHSLGEFDKALADYNQAARLDPLNPMTFLNRGILLAHKKRDRFLALIDFEVVLALEPNSSRVLRRAEQERAALMVASGPESQGDAAPQTKQF